jgi:hypothetical protein
MSAAAGLDSGDTLDDVYLTRVVAPTLCPSIALCHWVY